MTETKTSPFMIFGSLIKILKEFLEFIQPFLENSHFCKILRACFGGFTMVSFSKSLGSAGITWGPRASHWGPRACHGVHEGLIWDAHGPQWYAYGPNETPVDPRLSENKTNVNPPKQALTILKNGNFAKMAAPIAKILSDS